MNPLHICYANDAHLRAEQYAGTTSAFVLGRSNCVKDEWMRCRDRGSETYRYMLLIGRPNARVSAPDEEIYMGDSSKVPLWPYKDANGNQRSHYANSLMADIRIGSPFVSYVLDYFAKQLRLRRYSGYFLDTFGGRLWNSAGWDQWPADERAEWTASAAYFIRLLDEVRRAEDPSAIIVCNNTWDNAQEAEQYIDGVCSENHTIDNIKMQKTVGRPYGNLGHRRVFKMTRIPAEAAAWADVPGVTHMFCSNANVMAGESAYGYPSKPVVGYSEILDDSLSAQIVELQKELQNALFDLARAKGERDAAIEQRTVAQQMLDDAAAQRDEALAQRETAVLNLDAALGREAAASTAAFNLQAKINSIRSIIL